jgi:hypothetical protein
LTLPGAALAAKNDAKINVACLLVWIILLDCGSTHMKRRICLPILFFLTSIPFLGQECTSTVLVSFYDQLTTAEIETLKAEDIDARLGNSSLPVLSASRDFHNRLLILVEMDGAAKNAKMENVVETVTQQARTAPEGEPVAFGIYSDKAIFSEDFQADPDKRAKAVDAVIEEENSLKNRVALWDALHQALAKFGPHQPGDTILLIGEPYDDASHRSGSDVEKEFLANGTRLFIMRRIHASRVERDFMWSSHELEKSTFNRLTQETGGLISEYVPSLIRFAWAGYFLELKLPPDMNKPKKWKVKFRGNAAIVHRKTNFYYPAVLPPCRMQQATAR